MKQPQKPVVSACNVPEISCTNVRKQTEYSKDQLIENFNFNLKQIQQLSYLGRGQRARLHTRIVDMINNTHSETCLQLRTSCPQSILLAFIMEVPHRAPKRGAMTPLLLHLTFPPSKLYFSCHALTQRQKQPTSIVRKCPVYYILYRVKNYIPNLCRYHVRVPHFRNMNLYKPCRTLNWDSLQVSSRVAMKKLLIVCIFLCY